jgi:hypothetical protein
LSESEFAEFFNSQNFKKTSIVFRLIKAKTLQLFNLKTLQLFNIFKKRKKVFDFKNNHPIFAVLKIKEKE